MQLNDLLKLIQKHYSLEELSSLCFVLDIDEEEFESRSKTAKIQELLVELRYQKRLPELIKVLAKDRPNAVDQWEDIYKDIRSIQDSYKGKRRRVEDPFVDTLPDAPFQAPAIINDFVGRQDLLSEIEEILLSDKPTCVIHGIGGGGKTTAATKVAYNLRAIFNDGVIWVDLSGAVKNNQIDEVFMRNILVNIALTYHHSDVAQGGDLRTLSQNIRGILANKEVLLILDNAYGAQDINLLLPPSPSSCSTLITTRNQRAIRDIARQVELTSFSTIESLEFLRKIIGSERVDRELDSAEQLVKFIDGLPLALRIISSDLADSTNFELKEYCGLLHNERSRLDHLIDWEDASKDIRASFELSYARLQHEELQNLFLSLSCFEGHDFDFQAVKEISNLNALLLKKNFGRLLSLSLLQQRKQKTVKNVSNSLKEIEVLRYRLHPLLRAFAREKLQLNQYKSLNRLASQYFLDLVSKQRDSFSAISLDWSNIWASLQWAKGNNKWSVLNNALESLTVIKFGVAGFLDSHGYWDEAIQLLETIWEEKHEIDVTHKQEWYAFIRLKQGIFAFRQFKQNAEFYFKESLRYLKEETISIDKIIHLAYVHDFLAQLAIQTQSEDALNYSQSGLGILDQLDDDQVKSERGYLYIRHASILGRMGEPSALEFTQKGLDLLPDEPTSARVSGLMNLGNLHLFKGEIKLAIKRWQTASSDARILGNSRLLAGIWRNLGIVESMQCNFASATEYFNNALAVHKQLNDVHGTGANLLNLADDYISLGQDELAQNCLAEALQIAEDNNIDRVRAFALVNLSKLHLYNDELENAKECLHQAANLCQELELAEIKVEIAQLQARLALAEKIENIAEAKIEESLKWASSQEEKGISWRLKGQLLLYQDKPAKAKEAFLKSLDLFLDQNKFEYAKTQLELGKLYWQFERTTKGDGLLKKALIVFREINARREQSECEKVLNQAPS